MNGFGFEAVRRFYMVENFTTEVVRAFHGHMKEEKFVLVVQGAIIVAAVQFGDPANPNRNAKPHRFVLTDRQPQILHVPAGYANGFAQSKLERELCFSPARRWRNPAKMISDSLMTMGNIHMGRRASLNEAYPEAV